MREAKNLLGGGLTNQSGTHSVGHVGFADMSRAPRGKDTETLKTLAELIRHMAPQRRDNAIRFFYREAPYSWTPARETEQAGRWRGARALADAEAWAASVGLTFTWDWDPEPWDGDGPAPQEVLGCVARWRDGAYATSLWGIGDPSDAYRRVVEAELAHEARAEMRARLEQAR